MSLSLQTHWSQWSRNDQHQSEIVSSSIWKSWSDLTSEIMPASSSSEISSSISINISRNLVTDMKPWPRSSNNLRWESGSGTGFWMKTWRPPSAPPEWVLLPPQCRQRQDTVYCSQPASPWTRIPLTGRCDINWVTPKCKILIYILIGLCQTGSHR